MAPRGVNRDSVKTGCLQTRYHIPCSSPADAVHSARHMSQKSRTMKGAFDGGIFDRISRLNEWEVRWSGSLCVVWSV